jgi:hypothetical protein
VSQSIAEEEIRVGQVCGPRKVSAPHANKKNTYFSNHVFTSNPIVRLHFIHNISKII